VHKGIGKGLDLVSKDMGILSHALLNKLALFLGETN